MALKDRPGSVMSLGFLLWGPALILFITIMALASGQEFDRGTIGQKLSLDIYLYETGQTLVAGYVENPMSLSFLKPPRYTTEYAARYAARYVPDYKYENDTRQLYAWTDALTMKREETWSLIFLSRGFYDEYQIVFHLPSDLRLGMINSSAGLKYMVSASNDSLIVDVQGYGVRDPAISVEYQQPMVIENNGIKNNGNSSYDGKNRGIGSNVSLSQTYLLLILAFIIIGGVVVVLLVSRKDAPLTSEPPVPKSETVKLDDTEALSGATMPETEEKATSYEEQIHEASALGADLSENFSEDEEGFDETMPEVTQLEGAKKEKEKEIAVSSEMKAVMDALTHRERSIMEALIKHGGRMTQAEIRYETGLPRSSLTMVLVSLERRNLITKKEWGRTNVIELSERFLSKKEQS